MNEAIRWMTEHNIPLTARNYVEICWFGQKTLKDLEGEDRIDVG